MEVHRQYNLRSKKSNDNPTKKASDFKKTSDTLAKKVPEKKNSEVPIKRTSDSIPKTTQTDVPSTSQPKYTTHKNVVEKSDIHIFSFFGYFCWLIGLVVIDVNPWRKFGSKFR